ncbi:hydrolase [Dictyobacter vulcani]|uniref:Hydrolase n=1 Tax=Dictyobacter vulcani TaxID=2607529 RepID=A0A5J4KZ62_9CHLR|nr:alpha/beta hydrolase [Dictyobacter vulcani]GER91840.1 hydrolase [Dictyobacter vulcani]
MANTENVQTGFADVNNTKLYYEVAGTGHPFILIHGHLLDRRSWDDQFAVFAQQYRVIRYDQRGFGDSGLVTGEKPYSARQDLYELMKFLGIESAYLMGVSGGGALAIDFTLEHPELVDALIPVTAGVSGFQPSEEMMKDHPVVARMYTSLNDAFEQHDIARAVDISLDLWTDGPGRLPAQAAPDVRERVRAMTTRNWERPDEEIQDQMHPIPLEPPAIERLSTIAVPTLIILGALDVPNPLEHLAAEIPAARKIIMADTAHHPFMEKPSEFNQIVLDFLGSLKP